jgi:putative addiction module component (TIGR02574 family)
MGLPLEKLEAQVMELSEKERAYLAQRLLVSLDDMGEDDPAEVEQAWSDELRRRIDEVENGTVEMIPAEEMMAEFWARRRK